MPNVMVEENEISFLGNISSQNFFCMLVLIEKSPSSLKVWGSIKVYHESQFGLNVFWAIVNSIQMAMKILVGLVAAVPEPMVQA